MEVIINGEVQHFPDNTHILDMVHLLFLEGRRIAIEINGEVIPRSQYPARRLQDNDKIEIIRAVGGG